MQRLPGSLSQHFRSTAAVSICTILLEQALVVTLTIQSSDLNSRLSCMAERQAQARAQQPRSLVVAVQQSIMWNQRLGKTLVRCRSSSLQSTVVR